MAPKATVGQLAAELVINNKQAADALKMIERLATSTQMRLDEMAKANRQLSQSFVDSGGRIRGYNKDLDTNRSKMGEGEKALRGFYKEQRLQDRTMRESIATLQSLTFAFAFLTQGQDDGSKTTRRVTEGMMVMFATAQSLEFGLFAVGRAGASMSGSLGMILTRIGALAGPIGIILGLGAGLVAFFASANKEVDQFAEKGLDNLIKRLNEAGGGSTAFLRNIQLSIEAQQAAVNMLLESGKKLTEPGAGSFSMGPLGAILQSGQAAAKESVASDALKEQNEERRKIIEKIKDAIKEQSVMNDYLSRANQYVREHGSRYQVLKLEIEDLNTRIQTQVLSEEDRRKLIDERIEKENELKNLTLSTFDIETKRVAKMEALVKLNQATNDDVIAQIDHTLTLKLTEEQRLALQVKRVELLDKEAAERAKVIKEGQEGLDNLTEYIKTAQAESIVTAPTDQTLDANIDAINAIASQKKMKADLQYDEDIKQIEANYEKLGYSEENFRLYKEALQAAETRRDVQKQNDDLEAQQKIIKARQDAYEKDLDQIDRIGAHLQKAFNADTFIAKLGQGLQIAAQIAHTLNNIGSEGVGPLDFLEILGPIAGFVGLFDEGGSVKGGRRGEARPAIVHVGETVLPTHRYPLGEALARVMSQSKAADGMRFATGGVVPAMAFTDTSIISSVMRRNNLDLVSAIQKLSVQVHLYNTMTGQRFLRKEIPKFNEFQSRKEVTPG